MQIHYFIPVVIIIITTTAATMTMVFVSVLIGTACSCDILNDIIVNYRFDALM